jgi:hypothetical protein
MVSPAVITTTVKHSFQPKAYTFSRLHPEEDAFPVRWKPPLHVKKGASPNRRFQLKRLPPVW